MDEHLGRLLTQLEKRLAASSAPSETDEEVSFTPEVPEVEAQNEEDLKRIEQLFEQAAQDRSRAYELKNELDRLGVFKDYEDWFLDLFRE